MGKFLMTQGRGFVRLRNSILTNFLVAALFITHHLMWPAPTEPCTSPSTWGRSLRGTSNWSTSFPRAGVRHHLYARPSIRVAPLAPVRLELMPLP